MDLTKYGLPSAIEVGGKSFPIHTDFQYFLTFIKIVKKQNVKETDFDFMFVSQKPRNKTEALKKLIAFTYPERKLPRPTEKETDEIMLDYDQDAELIYSAFYQQYGIDLFADNLHLHWYKFQALLFGLQDTKMNKVIEFRSYTPSKNDSAEYKKQMNRLKNAWRIEEELTDEEKAMIARFDAKLKKD